MQGLSAWRVPGLPSGFLSLLERLLSSFSWFLQSSYFSPLSEQWLACRKEERSRKSSCWGEGCASWDWASTCKKIGIEKNKMSGKMEKNLIILTFTLIFAIGQSLLELLMQKGSEELGRPRGDQVRSRACPGKAWKGKFKGGFWHEVGK